MVRYLNCDLCSIPSFHTPGRKIGSFIGYAIVLKGMLRLATLDAVCDASCFRRQCRLSWMLRERWKTGRIIAVNEEGCHRSGRCFASEPLTACGIEAFGF